MLGGKNTDQNESSDYQQNQPAETNTAPPPRKETAAKEQSIDEADDLPF
jgi:hypothetical protein